jgi:hypothetical protein
VVEIEAGAEETSAEVEASSEPEIVEEDKQTPSHETTATESVARDDESNDLTLDEEPGRTSTGRSATTAPEAIDLDEDESSSEPADDAGEAKVAATEEPDAGAAKPEASSPKVDDAQVVNDGDRKADSKGDPVPCQACDTTGQCSHCKGRGRRARFFRCGECGGSGRCSVCGGPGYVWADN